MSLFDDIPILVSAVIESMLFQLCSIVEVVGGYVDDMGAV